MMYENTRLFLTQGIILLYFEFYINKKAGLRFKKKEKTRVFSDCMPSNLAGCYFQHILKICSILYKLFKTFCNIFIYKKFKIFPLP